MTEREKGKRRLGFKTSASEIQDEFEELFSILAIGKVNWSKMVDQTNEYYKVSKDKLEEARKLKSGEAFTRILALQRYLSLSNLIAQLGTQLTLVQEHVVRCEKAIEELKLRTK